MKNRSWTCKLILILIIVFSSLNFLACSKDKEKEVTIEKWDNFYEGDNIKFYYEDAKNPNLQKLKKQYNLEDEVKQSKDDFDKALKLMAWVNKKLKFNKTSVSTKKDALSILKAGENNTLSDKDFSIVYSQAAASIGIYARRGEFTPDKKEDIKDNKCYYICEVWSDKYNKWIALDVANNSYVEYKGKFLSAIELMEIGVDSVNIKGVENVSKYIKKLKPCMSFYTIEIDNNIYGVTKSNSYVTYLSKNSLIAGLDLKKPNIFVKSSKLFNMSPRSLRESKNKDNEATLIFSRQKPKEKKEKEEEVVLYGAVFKDSGMEQGFFISVDGSSFNKINRYFTVTLKEGENNVRFSEDGKKVKREVTIKYKK